MGSGGRHGRMGGGEETSGRGSGTERERECVYVYEYMYVRWCVDLEERDTRQGRKVRRGGVARVLVYRGGACP